MVTPVIPRIAIAVKFLITISSLSLRTTLHRVKRTITTSAVYVRDQQFYNKKTSKKKKKSLFTKIKKTNKY